jgi:hypothetical protein
MRLCQMLFLAQMRTRAEVKRILLKPSADRTEQEVYYVSNVTSVERPMFADDCNI